MPAVAATPAQRRQAVAGPAVLGAGALAGATAVRLRDPHTDGSWGLCPLLRLTGVLCPLCGGLRAVNDLTHLDVAAAASSNLLVVALLPVAATLWTLWVVRSWRHAGQQVAGDPAPSTRSRRLLAGAVLGLAVVAFTIVRNASGGWWLAP